MSKTNRGEKNKINKTVNVQIMVCLNIRLKIMATHKNKSAYGQI